MGRREEQYQESPAAREIDLSTERWQSVPLSCVGDSFHRCSCVLSRVGSAEYTNEGNMTENQKTSKCRQPWAVRGCFAWTLKLRLPGLDSEAGSPSSST